MADTGDFLRTLHATAQANILQHLNGPLIYLKGTFTEEGEAERGLPLLVPPQMATVIGAQLS